MGMFIAKKHKATNASVKYISSQIKCIKNKVIDYLNNLPIQSSNELINNVIGLSLKYKKNIEINKEVKEEIIRMKNRMQKKIHAIVRG